ncbi:hypothetical protein [uncultured Cellulomonas sp.]|uniref:hypothetical protein n=1 Tax=uncultured Cellulomonas sp. TaxID=189682 RepID=UPI0026336CB8|nr:hypothetical protein [uncultured Cellulomonas sp.]
MSGADARGARLRVRPSVLGGLTGRGVGVGARGAGLRAARGAVVRRTRTAPVRLGLGPALPAAVLRLLPGALVLALGALLGTGDAVRVLAAAAAVLVVARPAWPIAGPLVLLAGLAVLTGPDRVTTGGGAADALGVPGPVRLAAVLLLLDVTLRALSLAAHAAWGGRVEWAVLGRAGRVALSTQLVVQPVLLLVLAVRAMSDGAGPGWLRVLALATAGLLLGLALPRARAGRETTARWPRGRRTRGDA